MDDSDTITTYTNEDLVSTKQEVSLDEVIACTSQDKLNQSHEQDLVGSYVCKLIYAGNPDEYYVTHPKKSNHAIPLLKTIIEFTPEHEGSEVLVVFDGGDSSKPIVTGFVKAVIDDNRVNLDKVEIEKDKKETLVLEADKEIVLKCGKSSITLTRAGKVLIRGAYLLSRSSGINRIKGGSVHLN